MSLFDLDEPAGRAAARTIEDEGGRALFVRGDVGRDADARRAVDETVSRYGRLDILFNNAGIIRRATVVDTSEEDWDRVMEVNVKGVFLLSRRAVPVMARTGGGVIVNTASVWGLVGGARAAVYCASKGAVALLTKAMAIDHGAQNIRVNCICPGDTDTPMQKKTVMKRLAGQLALVRRFRRVITDARFLGSSARAWTRACRPIIRSEAGMLGDPLDRHMEQAADVPLRRVARPEDIAQAALYLASEASSFVSGAPLIVDGGFVAGGGS